jgi:hypothetical protein
MLKKEPIPVLSKGAFVTSITYCEDKKIYGACCSDGYLHFWV